MKKLSNKSLYSIHKSIAKEQFKELDYKDENPSLARKIFVNGYFNSRTKEATK